MIHFLDFAAYVYVLPHWVFVGALNSQQPWQRPDSWQVYTLIVVVLMVIFALAFMHALNKARCFFSENEWLAVERPLNDRACCMLLGIFSNFGTEVEHTL